MPGHTIAPVTAYLPTGMADAAALPLGKYYPTNYEKRKRAKREILAQQQQQRGKEHQLEKKKRKQDHYDHDHDHATDYQMPADDNTTTTIGRPSISQTSTSPHSQAGSPSSGGGGSSRNSKTTAAAGQGGSATQQELPPGSQNDAEVRRLRLLQYQRDMIAQASLAASRIVKQSGGSVAVPGTFAVAAAGSRYANASVSTHEDSATMTSTTAAGMSSSSSSSRRHRKGSSSAAPPMTLDLGSTPRANRGPPASSTLMFTGPTAFGSGAVVGEPVSPRLLPLASPGDGHPVTPMALEMERLDLGDAGRGYGSADGENEEERSDVSECDREYITSSRGGRMLNG